MSYFLTTCFQNSKIEIKNWKEICIKDFRIFELENSVFERGLNFARDASLVERKKLILDEKYYGGSANTSDGRANGARVPEPPLPPLSFTSLCGGNTRFHARVSLINIEFVLPLFAVDACKFRV